MRRPLQAPWATSALRASRQPARERRAAGSASQEGCCVRLGPGALQLPVGGLDPSRRHGLREMARTVLTVGAGFSPSSLPLVESGVAVGVTLGLAPLQGASGGPRRGLAPGLPEQAFHLCRRCPARCLGLGLKGCSGWPSLGPQVRARRPVAGFRLNVAVSHSSLGPDTAVCGGRDQSLMPRRGRVVLEVDPAARGARGGPSGLRPRPADTVSTPPGLRSDAQPLAKRAA